MIEILVILVVETDEIVASDDAYYGWILKNFFTEYVVSSPHSDLKIIYKFVHMSGKTNFRKKNIENEIKTEINCFKSKKAYVIYCFDVDNGTIKNNDFISEAKAYCEEKGYFISLANKEIEDVLNVPNPKSTKHERVKLFSKKYPKKSDYDHHVFYVPIESVSTSPGQTNFGLVIQEIINLAFNE